MMNKRNTLLSATAAIAATLALAPSAALAQAIEVPEISAPSTPPPALPETSVPVTPAPVMTSSPVVQTVAPPEIPAADTDATSRTESTATTRATSRAATPTRTSAAAPATRAPAAPEPVIEAAKQDAPIAAVPVAPKTAPTPVTTAELGDPDATDNTTLLGIVLGSILVLAFAVWGFVAIGRRKPADRRAATVIKPIPQRAVTPDPIIAATPMVAEPVAVPPTPIRQPTPAASLSHTGAAVPLPRTMPATFEERETLIKRMVEAKPDRANPFNSPIQRRKRARLILQSLGRDFGDAEPWIDLSQYPQNWPELSRNKYAAA